MAKIGRPTNYRPTMIAKVDEYLEKNKDKYWEFHKTRGEKSDSYERRVTVNLPTIEGFGQFIDVGKRQLYEWGDKFPEFGHALDKISAEQKRRVVEGGLNGDYNPMIAKLILSANHGMSDKTELTGKDGKDLQGVMIYLPSHGDQKE